MLILDEPTAALGQREADRLFDDPARPEGRGHRHLYVSHRFAEILDLCDRATVLRNGRVVTTTDLAGWTEARLTEAMVGGGSELFVATRRAAPGERCPRSQRPRLAVARARRELRRLQEARSWR